MRVAILLTLLAIAVAGCGSSNDNGGGGGGGGGGKPAYCKDKDQLKSSLQQLGNVDFKSQGLSGVQNKVQDVRNAATTLAGSAKAQFGPKAQALKSAASSLGTAVETAASAPSRSSLATVALGITSLRSAFQDLSNSIQSRC